MPQQHSMTCSTATIYDLASSAQGLTAISNLMIHVRHCIQLAFPLVQKGCWFFIGLGLCNSMLTVAFSIRGYIIFMPPIDIYTNLLTFLLIPLTVTNTSSTWLGFDLQFNLEKNTVTINRVKYEIVCTLSQLFSIAGRGTVVYLLKLLENSLHYFAFKQLWVNSHCLIMSPNTSNNGTCQDCNFQHPGE